MFLNKRSSQVRSVPQRGDQDAQHASATAPLRARAASRCLMCKPSFRAAVLHATVGKCTHHARSVN